LPRIVCLLVDLSVSRITLKVMDELLYEIWTKNEQLMLAKLGSSNFIFTLYKIAEFP